MKKYMAKGLTFVLSFAIVFTSFAFYNAEYSYAAAKPGKVSVLKVTKINSTTVKLSWKKAANAKKYEVCYLDDYGKWTAIKTVKNPRVAITQGQAWEFKYKVRAVNGKKKSVLSKAVSVKLPVTNYPEYNVPDYGTLYDCRVIESATDDGITYYVYNKCQWRDDYVKYLKNNGWKVTYEEDNYIVLGKNNLAVGAKISKNKDGKKCITIAMTQDN